MLGPGGFRPELWARLCPAGLMFSQLVSLAISRSASPATGWWRGGLGFTASASASSSQGGVHSRQGVLIMSVLGGACFLSSQESGVPWDELVNHISRRPALCGEGTWRGSLWRPPPKVPEHHSRRARLASHLHFQVGASQGCSERQRLADLLCSPDRETAARILSVFKRQMYNTLQLDLPRKPGSSAVGTRKNAQAVPLGRDGFRRGQ